MPKPERLTNLWPEEKPLFISCVAKQDQKTGG